jgi:hypothetical protein
MFAGVAQAAHHIPQREVKSAWQTFVSARGQGFESPQQDVAVGQKRSLRTLGYPVSRHDAPASGGRGKSDSTGARALGVFARGSPGATSASAPAATRASTHASISAGSMTCGTVEGLYTLAQRATLALHPTRSASTRAAKSRRDVSRALERTYWIATSGTSTS